MKALKTIAEEAAEAELRQAFGLFFGQVNAALVGDPGVKEKRIKQAAEALGNNLRATRQSMALAEGVIHKYLSESGENG